MSVLVPLLLVVATGASSQIRTDTRSLERDASIVRFVESDGRVVEKSERGERRVLIELRARPLLDRKAPGTVAEVRRQREQLERELGAIDTRVKARVPSRVTRRYQTLFSGVAAVVSAKSLAEIRRLPDVVVHDDVEVHAQLTESVPMIGAPTVWSSYGVTGVGVKVAVIDSGIDYTHPDLGGCFGGGCRVAGGHDFVNDDADPMDDNGHGTHVAGIVAANGTLKGVAPGATLLAYKALNANGDGFESDVIAALEQAVADGAKVANLSLGGPGNPNDALSQAVDNATAAGLLSVVAAGNSGNAYRTIDSPGVARTALTVGAIDKAGAITSFSSRGDVSDGVQSVMKPEIVAPGVAIRSTVPASGMHGDPSRYATLSGTSMATPHVAGAAALLLQWNAAQSPADLKNRLTASALASLGDPFTEGAGRVDLVPAFGLSILSSVAHVPLGVATGSSGTVTIQKTFSLRNTSASAKSLTLAASRPLPAGTTLGIVPASVTLEAGESVDVTLTLQVDTAVTPEAPEPLAWSTSIGISGGGPTTNVPVYFFRGSLLTLTFDEVPLRVTLLNPLQNLVRYVSDPPGASFSTLLQSGTWDVLVHFRTIYGAPIPIVVREELSVQNQRSLSIERVDANRALTVQPVDHDQQPLNASDGTTDMMLALRDPLSPDRIWFLTALGSSTLEDLRLSSLSSRYLVGIIAGAPAPLARYYIYNWSGVGLNQDVVLPDAGTPMRRLSQAAPSFPSATLIAYTGFTVKMREATVTMQLGNGNFHPAWSDGWTFYRQTTSAFGPPVIFSHQTNLTSLSDVINGPFLRYDGGDEIQADRLPYFNIFDPSRASDAILGAAVERWDVDAPPNGLPLRFQNSTSFVHAIAESFEGPAWLTSTLGSIQTASGAAPQFTLSRGGVPVTTLPLPQLFDLISSPAGPHELRSASAYKIGNVAGTSNVVASFNTSAGDPNPPYVSRFRIEQNGQPTVTPLRPSESSTTRVLFRAMDDASLTSVVLEWKQTGNAAWHATPLTNVGAEYSAPFAQEGSVDLRLSASDASGNTFQQEWLPAVITTGSPAPAAPSQVLATREGATSIRLNWASSSGPAGVREYRIERLPGPQSATVSADTTTFLDTEGLVAGGVYAYRVIAVGNDDAVSTPSGYDVAALVSFQDEPLMPGVTPIRGAHVAELRSAIDVLRQVVSLPPSWMSAGAPSGLVTAADFAAMRDRMNDARTILGLAPAQFSMPFGVGTLIRASHLQELRDALR